MFDHYRVLKVAHDSRAQELEEAYGRELAALARIRIQLWASFRGALLESAYKTLSDPIRRRMYNQHLRMFGGPFPQPPV